MYTYKHPALHRTGLRLGAVGSAGDFFLIYLFIYLQMKEAKSVCFIFIHINIRFFIAQDYGLARLDRLVIYIFSFFIF